MAGFNVFNHAIGEAYDEAVRRYPGLKDDVVFDELLGRAGDPVSDLDDYVDDYVTRSRRSGETRTARIKDIETAISNWSRLPREVKRIILSASDFRLPIGSEMLFYKGRQIIASATVYFEPLSTNPHPLFNDVESVHVRDFWVRGDDGEPINLM